MIIDSSGKGCKVWKSEVISPAVIVDSGSGSHVGSFRVDCTGSKQTNYTKICFIRKPNNTIRVLIGLCKFWGPWAHRVITNIVVYGIVLYYKGFLLYVLLHLNIWLFPQLYTHFFSFSSFNFLWYSHICYYYCWHCHFFYIIIKKHK